jgi:hypothetical protein
MDRYYFFKLFWLLLVSLHVYAQSPQDGWRFTYPGDNFTEDALLDLSYLNEEVAGENGFIRLSQDSSYFVNDQGEVRFWAINGGTLVRGHDPDLSDADLVIYAKFLAKMGVNMIRFHGEMFSTTQDINQPNTEEADYIWRVVAAMKEQGIYTTISPFWPAHMENIPQNWGLGDYWGDKDPWGLIYFNQKFRDAYKSWVEYVYTEINPHTGIALKDDPAVALIQILNEDGVFFWTIGGVEPSLMTEMQQQFFDWTQTKYGTIQDAFNAWENTSLPADDIGQGLLEIINIWFATDDQNVPAPTPGFDKRLTDQMHFFAEVQRNTYQEFYDHYRSIGCQQLINASNWKTASPIRLFDLERWTNLATEVLAVNRYYSPLHVGENSGWRIERGHHFEGNSALFYPHKLPINIKQAANRPFLVTESGWNLPHKYQAEGPFLISAYMSLTGVDAFYWFSPSAITYDDDPYFPYWGEINGELPMFRWTCSIPGQVGMFPANALAYRNGYIQQGNVVLHEERTFESLIEREIPLISEENSFDPNRDTYNPDPEEGETLYSPLTYLAGPVEVVYEGDPSNNMVAPDLNELVNIGEKKITSITGELTWDYRQGICVLDAPKVQGICGFPGEDPYQLSDVTITSKNDYAVVNVVSMDDLPLGESEQILIQVGTVYRPNGWQVAATTFSPEEGADEVEGYRIQSLGSMPWKGAKTMVKIDIKNTNVKSAWLLDEAGYEDQEFFVTDMGDGISMWLPVSAMYVILDTRPSSIPSGLEDEEDDSIIIYPNPTFGNFQIKLSDEYHAKGISKLEVMDIFGKTIRSYNYNEENFYSLNVSPGTYLFKLHTREGEEKIKRLIIY